MLSKKTKLTNRKFYNKWLYKVTLICEGCSLFRSKSLDEIKEFCLGEDPAEHRFSLWTRAYNNKEDILDICNFLDVQDKNLYKLRIERNNIDFYTNDPTFYKDLSEKFERIVRHRFEPNVANLDLLQEDKSYIVVSKLPKNRYNYRVYLLPHKMANDPEGKQRYLSWLKSQSPRITCTPAIEEWFIKTNWNWDRRYVLVEDESTLLMLKLRNSEVVGRIYNFVVSDK